MERRIHRALAASMLVGLAVVSPALAALDGLDEAMAAASLELANGAVLTTEEAADLERRVAEDPWDLESRTALIGYYLVRLADDEPPSAHREHILWLIEHEPEAPVLGLPVFANPVLDGPLYHQGAAIWNRHLERDPDNLTILHNASAYFLLAERELAVELLERASRIEPENTRWHERIGQARMLDAVMDTEPDTDTEPVTEPATEPSREPIVFFEIALDEADETRRPHVLADAAEAAVVAKDWEKAVAYANDLLRSTAEDTTNWFYGNAVHRGNLVLGHAALAQGDVDGAAWFLIRAGDTPGSPQLNSFGPRMRLARDLLEAGERDAVIEYLELCGRFWEKETVDAWVRTIEAGGMPDFGRHLR